MAVLMGGSNGSVEYLGGGTVVEGGFGAVIQFVDDGVEVELMAGDGGGPLGRYQRISRLVFSLVALSHGLWGERKTPPGPSRG